MKLRVLLATLVLTAGLASVAVARQMEEMNTVVLRTIDKVSARTRTFEVPVDKTVKFGSSLFIRLRSCRKSSPLDQPENAAFLQIWEKKPIDEKSRWVFSGWMFSSNPSLSAMDHPVYDVWVIECKNAVTAAKSQEFSTEKAPEGAPVKGEAEPSATTPEPASDKPAPASDKPASDKPASDKPASDTPAAPAAKPAPEPAPAKTEAAPPAKAPEPGEVSAPAKALEGVKPSDEMPSPEEEETPEPKAVPEPTPADEQGKE
jgi:hypothetical protein